MNSLFLRAARDPHCLLALDASRQWYAPLRPETLPSAPALEPPGDESPSWAEKMRLLTVDNLRFDRGVIEAAASDQTAGMKTKLDFRGNQTSKTFICRVFCPSHSDDGNLYIHPMVGQGAIHGGASAYVFQMALWENYRNEPRSVRLYVIASDGVNAIVANSAHLPNVLNDWHTFAAVFDYDSAPESARFTTFIDGEVLVDAQYGAAVWGQGTGSALSDHVGIREDSTNAYLANNSIDKILIFDRALAAAEVRMLSSAASAARQCVVGYQAIGQRWQTANYSGMLGSHYDNDPQYARFGKLLNNDEVKILDADLDNSNSLWRVPARWDLENMVQFAGGSAQAGRLLKSAGTIGDGDGEWTDPPAYNPSVDGRKEWPELLAAVQSRGTGNLKIEINFNCRSFLHNAYIVQNLGSKSAYFGVWQQRDVSEEQRIMSSNRLLVDVPTIAAVAYADGPHHYMITRQNGEVMVQLDSVVKNSSGTAIDLSTADISVPSSSADCYIVKLRLSDPDTDETLWEAGHADLYHDEYVGADIFGFSLLPGGVQNIIFTNLSDIGFLGTLTGYYIRAPYDSAGVSNNTNAAFSVSIRLMKKFNRTVIEGYDYKTVQLAGTEWLAENFRGEGGQIFDDGSLGSYFDYFQTLLVNNRLKAAGSVWRVPNDGEFQQIIDAVGSDNAAAVKAKTSWTMSPAIPQGSNASGLNALAAGYIYNAIPLNVGSNSLWNSVDSADGNDQRCKSFYLTGNSNKIGIYNSLKSSLLPLRLVRRFFDIELPGIGPRRFVKAGNVYIDTRNAVWTQPAEPRVYDRNPFSWTRYDQAIESAWELTHSYRLRIKFTLNAIDTTNRVIFGNLSLNGLGPVGLSIEPTGKIRASSAQYWRSADAKFTSILSSSTALDTGKSYEVEVVAQPNTVQLNILSAGYELSVSDAMGVQVADSRPAISGIISNFSGTIEELTVTDETAGVVVFQADDTELKNTIGRWPDDDPVAGAVHGRFYSISEHNELLAWLTANKLPFSTMTEAQFYQLYTYNGHAGSNAGLCFCDPLTFTSPPDGMDNRYETGFSASGYMTNADAWIKGGQEMYLMTRQGLVGSTNGGNGLGAYYPVATLEATYPNLRAPIRLIYQP